MITATTYPATSSGYRDALDGAMTGQVLDAGGNFCCAFGSECRKSVGSNGFAAGQLSYVGDHYAVASAGLPLRVLIVAMQVGDSEAPVDLSRRREQIRQRISQPFKQRNPHMQGVTTALRVLFGGEPQTDENGELLDTDHGPVHVLDAYAMANSVLCSNRPGAGRTGAPTKTMLDNCSHHLRATIKALQPTIIHSQGRRKSGPSTHRAIERLITDVQWDTQPATSETVATGLVDGLPVAWCSLRHPAHNWASPTTPYFRDVALPALRRTRELALET